MNTSLKAKYDEWGFERTFGHRDSGTYIREHAEHFCPQYSNADLIVPGTTEATSADGWMK